MKFVIFSLIFSSLLFAQTINEKIIFASARGELDSLNSFLMRDSVDLNYKYENGYTALDYAIERNHKEVFRRLIEYYSEKCDQAREQTKASNLIKAVVDGNILEVDTLLSSAINANSKHCSGYYPLSIAVRWGSIAMVELLLQHGADVNVINSNRYNTTVLMELSRNGNIEIGKLLISEGAKINQVDINNDPAINWATYFGQKELVGLLIKNGARTDIVGKDSGDDALAIARRMKFKQIEKLIIDSNGK